MRPHKNNQRVVSQCSAARSRPMRVPVKKQIRHIVLEEVGCVAKTQWTSLPGCSIFHDQTASAVQMAALRTRDYCLRGPLVSAVLAFVSGCRGIACGTRSPR